MMADAGVKYIHIKNEIVNPANQFEMGYKK
jgi:hypothetical protein